MVIIRKNSKQNYHRKMKCWRRRPGVASLSGGYICCRMIINAYASSLQDAVSLERDYPAIDAFINSCYGKNGKLKDKESIRALIKSAGTSCLLVARFSRLFGFFVVLDWFRQFDCTSFAHPRPTGRPFAGHTC